MLSDIMLAINLASRVHTGQVRFYTQEPYVNHVIRVASHPRVVERGPQAVCIAILHDAIEDAPDPRQVEEYIKNTFSDHIYETCLLLTHLNGTYASYKEKILNSGNIDALLIKASDSEDNSIIEPGMSDKHLKRCEIYKENVRVYLAKALELKLKRVKNEILK